VPSISSEDLYHFWAFKLENTPVLKSVAVRSQMSYCQIPLGSCWDKELIFGFELLDGF